MSYKSTTTIDVTPEMVQAAKDELDAQQSPAYPSDPSKLELKFPMHRSPLGDIFNNGSIEFWFWRQAIKNVHSETGRWAFPRYLPYNLVIFPLYRLCGFNHGGIFHDDYLTDRVLGFTYPRFKEYSKDLGPIRNSARSFLLWLHSGYMKTQSDARFAEAEKFAEKVRKIAFTSVSRPIDEPKPPRTPLTKEEREMFEAHLAEMIQYEDDVLSGKIESIPVEWSLNEKVIDAQYHPSWPYERPSQKYTD